MLTNSPPIAAALADHPAAEVVVIGGRLDKHAQVTVGAAAVDFIRTIRADACVLGVCALHPEAGLSTDDLEEAHVKRAMVEASADVIALATADKLRAASPYLVAPVGELTHVVSRGRGARRAARPLPRAGRHGDRAREPALRATTGVFFVNGAVVGIVGRADPVGAGALRPLQERDGPRASLAHGRSRVILAFPVAGQAHRAPRLPSGWSRSAARLLRARRHLPGARARPAAASRSALFVLGARSATMDVSMNSHGVAVEKALGRPIMSSLHAGWAFGGMFGAGFAARVHGARRRPRASSAAVALAVLLLALLSACAAGSAPARPPRARTRPASRCRRAASCCSPSSAFLVMVTEGAMADWGGLYLRQDLGASAGARRARLLRSSPAA